MLSPSATATANEPESSSSRSAAAIIQNKNKTRSRSPSPDSYSNSNSNSTSNSTATLESQQSSATISGNSSRNESPLHSSTTHSVDPSVQQNKNKRARTDSPAPSSLVSNQQSTDQISDNKTSIVFPTLPPSSSDTSPSAFWLKNTFVPQSSTIEFPTIGQSISNFSRPSFTLSNNLAVVDQSSSEMSVDPPISNPLPSSSSSTQQLPSYQNGSSESSSIPIKNPTVPKSQLPAGSDQLAQIGPLKNKSLVEGETWYILPRRWYQLWATKCSSSGEDKPSSKPTEVEGEGLGEDELDLELGPIKSIDLLAPGASLEEQVIPLKMPLVMGSDIEAVPKEAYELLESWYGVEGPSFPRTVISRNGDLRIELYPPKFTFIRIITGGEPAEKPLPLPTTLSILSTYSELIRLAKSSFDYHRILPNKGFRMTRIPEEVAKHIKSPEFVARPGVVYDWELIDSSNEEATLNDLQLDLPHQVLALEAGTGSKDWALGFPLHLKSHPQIKPAKNFPFSRPPGTDSFSALENNKQINNTSSNFNNTFNNNNSYSSGYATRSSTFYERSLNKTNGVTGLQNLGNTCFMNSALQCLSNTPQLQNYFLEGAYKKELNADNPLGMGGLLADSFGNLLQKLWSSYGGSHTPREFKSMLGKFAPQFLGYSQQDTQELLAFLLDGLHEDLNRILKKPYVELPDWEGGDEKKMVEFARTQWDLYKQRNDSVIVDLFQGQYKSTLVCPVCDNVSIKFDPFMYLTLPIPNKRKKRLIVHFLSLDLTKSITKVIVQLNEDDSIAKLKSKVLETVGLPFEKDSDLKRLVVADVWDHGIYSLMNDYEPIDTIKTSDFIYAYQLDSNFNTPKLNFKAKHTYFRSVEEAEAEIPRPSEDDDVALVPVLSAVEGEGYYPKDKNFGIPFFVEVPVSKFDDLKAIEEIVMRGYSRFTNKKTELETFTYDRPKFFSDLTANQQELLPNQNEVNGNGNGIGVDEAVAIGNSDLDLKSSSNSNEGSWEMVEGENTQIQPVSLVQSDQPKDSITSIRHEDDTTIVETSDVDPEPVQLLPSYSSQSDSNQETLNEVSRSLQEKVRMLKPQTEGTEVQTQPSDQVSYAALPVPFTMHIKVRSPEKPMVAQTDSTEELASRLERLKSQMEEFEKAQELKKQSESITTEDTTTSSESNQENQKEKEREKEKEPEEADDLKKPFPLLYNGSGILVKWKTAAKEYFFDDLENANAKGCWGPFEGEIKDPAIIKEEEEFKSSFKSDRNKKALTLEDCLNEFTKEEKLGEDDPWYCPKCKEFRQATKKFDLWKVPDILVVHLKRFSGGNRRNKLDDNIDFPIKGLDLTERVVGTKIYQDLEVSGELPPKSVKVNENGGMEGIEVDDNDEAVTSDQPIYDLYAVDNHYGGLGGGHYTAYAKNSKDKNWYSFDDSSTNKVTDVNTIKTPAAYLLFYCRRTTREIGGKTREVIASVAAAQEVSEDAAMNNNESTSFNVASTSTSLLPTEEGSYQSYSNLSNHNLRGSGGGFITASDHLKGAFDRRAGINEDYDREDTPNSDDQNDWRGPSNYPVHSSNSWDRGFDNQRTPNDSVEGTPSNSPLPGSDETFSNINYYQDGGDFREFGNGYREHYQGDVGDYHQSDSTYANYALQDQNDQGLNAPPPAPEHQYSQTSFDNTIMSETLGNDPMQVDPLHKF